MKSQRAFGEALRRHREQSGVTIESIAQQTKISGALLRALEQGDCSRWPTGIYSRSYIRDYAVAIGLDPDDLATQFSECFATTAYPDGPEKPPDPGPKVEPLRLTLVPEPQADLRLAARRAILVVLDCVLVLVLAAALRFTVASNFWIALGAVTIVLHSLSVAAGGRAASDLFAQLFRAPQPEPAPVVSETQESFVELT